MRMDENEVFQAKQAFNTKAIGRYNSYRNAKVNAREEKERYGVEDFDNQLTRVVRGIEAVHRDLNARFKVDGQSNQ